MHKSRAFTLVELMVSMVVLIIILLMLVQMVNSTSAIWRGSTAKVEQFRSARQGFEAIVRRLSQATLNTYWDYDDPITPTRYFRQSDLRFIVDSGGALINKTPMDSDLKHPTHAVFFQAPLGYFAGVDPSGRTTSDIADPAAYNAAYSGLENLLNTWGYFVEYGSDRFYRPQFIQNLKAKAPPERYRYRLMEYMQPADQLTIYHYTSGVQDPNASSSKAKNPLFFGHDWFYEWNSVSPSTGTATRAPLDVDLASFSYDPRPVHVLAENVVALVIMPMLSPQDPAAVKGEILSPYYRYDSTQVTNNRPGMDTPTSAPATTSFPNVNPKSQLPPVIRVTMIALDETSAARIAPANPGSNDPPEACKSTDFFKTTSSNGDYPVNVYSKDLQDFEAKLVKSRLSYRTFTSSVSLRAAKWSRY